MRRLVQLWYVPVENACSNLARHLLLLEFWLFNHFKVLLSLFGGDPLGDPARFVLGMCHDSSTVKTVPITFYANSILGLASSYVQTPEYG